MKRVVTACVGTVLLVLAAACDEARGTPAATSIATGAQAIVPATAPAAALVEDELARLRRELAETKAREDSLRVVVDGLRAEIKRAQEDRLAREREWLRYTQGLAKLESLALPPHFHADLPGEEATSASTADAHALLDANARPGVPSTAPAPTTITPTKPAVSDAEKLVADARAAEEARVTERNRAVFLALRSLFAVEQISGFDLLEAGVLDHGATGPVVLRVLDDKGRPLGSMSADRLRLEASIAARTLTLVLERGFERHAGVKTPFEGAPPDDQGRGGVRRIELAHVDPKPWIEALPELFPSDMKVEVVDDGRHDVRAVQMALNRVLKLDAAGGWHKVESVGGVQANVLRDVRLSVFDRDGNVEKELFADRMSIIAAERGIEILLEGGSQMRDGAKVPFLDGRYRIFLPRASVPAWREAKIPVIDVQEQRDARR